jgi:hypothetical protein
MADDTSVDSTTTEDNFTGDGVQSPALDKKGKPTRKAFKDGKQAWQCFRTLESDNRVRTSLNAEIVARHAGKPPHNQNDLLQAGQSWRSNFPTMSLMAIEGRITARLVSTVDNLRVLTNSHLSDKVEGGEDKSKKFQQKVTSAIRKWRGWRPFIAALFTEEVLIGYATVALLDLYNWRPRLFRSDECFLPQGCAQFPELVQMAGLKQSFLIHEAVDWVSNGKEIAEMAGFDFENVIEVTNKAKPKSPLQDQQGAADQSRVYQDLIREGNIGTSYSTGAKGIDVAHVLGTEPDTKKVTHYIVDRNDNNVTLFCEENQFDSMNDCLCMFTLEPGNSSYYGSKGIARKILNMTVAQDVTANDAVDAYRLSALGILTTDSKGGIATQIKVNNPFVIVSTDAVLQKQAFNFDAESFTVLYSKIGDMIMAAVGEYLPNQLNPDDPSKEKTATAENIDYQREQQQSQAHIARALGQFFEMVQAMQKRLCDPETTDDEAKELQEDLLESGLSEEEIEELAESPTAEVVQDLAAQKDQQIVQAGAAFKGDPDINQLLLKEKVLSAMTSPQTASELLLPEGIDPTIAAENVRQQAMENIAMQSGGNINISPRDNDEEHLKTLIGDIDQSVPGLMQKQPNDPDLPQLMDNLNAAIVHGDAHVASGKQKTPDNPVWGQYEQKLKGYTDGLHKMAQVVAKTKAMQQQQPQGGAMTAPNGQGPQQGQQQAPPQEPAPQPEPPAQAMTEKVLVAWISQYTNLREGEQRLLEQKGFLGSAPDTNPQVQEVNQVANPAPRPGEVQNATAAPTS